MQHEYGVTSISASVCVVFVLVRSIMRTFPSISINDLLRFCSRFLESLEEKKKKKLFLDEFVLRFVLQLKVALKLRRNLTRAVASFSSDRRESDGNEASQESLLFGNRSRSFCLLFHHPSDGLMQRWQNAEP